MDFTIVYNTGHSEPADYRVTFNGPPLHRSFSGIALSYSTFRFADIQSMADWVESWDNEPPLFGFTIKSIEKIGEPGL